MILSVWKRSLTPSWRAYHDNLKSFATNNSLYACAIRLFSFPWIQEEEGREGGSKSGFRTTIRRICTRVRSFSRPDSNHWWYRHTFLCLVTCCSPYFLFSCPIWENASICVHLLPSPCVHPGTVVQTKTHKPSPSLPLSTIYEQPLHLSWSRTPFSLLIERAASFFSLDPPFILLTLLAALVLSAGVKICAHFTKWQSKNVPNWFDERKLTLGYGNHRWNSKIKYSRALRNRWCGPWCGQGRVVALPVWRSLLLLWTAL